MPLTADRFLKAAIEYIEPLRGTYIYDLVVRDYKQKCGIDSRDYELWLRNLLQYFDSTYSLKGRKILDFGCGTGELTVLMNSLGFDATGIDVHSKHLRLARILAQENGLPDSVFVQSMGERLPFEDNSFDVVTLFVVLEHLDDKTLTLIVPELRRICRGVLFVQVPNKWMTRDDHTGLFLVPWMPRWLASRYVRLWGSKRRYSISDSGDFDVTYRTLVTIKSIFAKAGCDCHFVPDALIFPPLNVAKPLHQLRKQIKVGSRNLFLRLPLPFKLMFKLHVPEQNFHLYLNLVFQPVDSKT